jgi:hypothetical protein
MEILINQIFNKIKILLRTIWIHKNLQSIELPPKKIWVLTLLTIDNKLEEINMTIKILKNKISGASLLVKVIMLVKNFKIAEKIIIIMLMNMNVK